MRRNGKAHSRPADERVVVTGMGALTSLGSNVAATWDGLVQGRSGVRRWEEPEAEHYPSRIISLVDDFQPEDYIEPKSARRMSRFAQFAVAAGRMALDDARYTVDGDGSRVGVVLGNGVGGLSDLEHGVRTLMAKGGMRISPFLITMTPSNLAAFHVAHTFGLRGYNSTVVTACASGTQAIGEAFEVIRRGQADALLCGGTEAGLCELVIAMFSVNRAYSRRNEEPEKASRPFDLERDGFVPAEGAGVLLLERLSQAEARGARIYAEVLGYGASSDAYHLIAPEPEGAGAGRAMQWAIQSAGIAPQQIDYINAHAASTPLGDAAETRAIKAVLGDHAYRVPISATKSMLGHLFGAAGGVEAIATVKTVETGWIHPTINLDSPDPECDLDYVPHQARRADVRIAMSNSFGLGGQNAVVILGRYEAG